MAIDLRENLQEPMGLSNEISMVPLKIHHQSLIVIEVKDIGL